MTPWHLRDDLVASPTEPCGNPNVASPTQPHNNIAWHLQWNLMQDTGESAVQSRTILVVASFEALICARNGVHRPL